MTAGMCLNVHSNSHIEYNSQTIGRPQQTKENHVNNSGEAIFPNKQKMTKMDKKKTTLDWKCVLCHSDDVQNKYLAYSQRHTWV